MTTKWSLGGYIILKMSRTINIGHLDILHLVYKEVNTVTKISKKLQMPRTTVSRHVKDLCDNGYLKKTIIANERLLQLKKLGQEAVTISLNTLRSPQKKGDVTLKVHKITWSAVISKKPWKLHDDLKKNSFIPSRHNNWNKYSRKYLQEDVTVVFNPDKVYFYIHEFYIDNPMEYYNKAKAKVLEICKDLQDKFPGLLLGTPKRFMTVHTQHIVKQGGPLATKFEEHALKTGNPEIYHGTNLDIDHSQGVWEEETKDNKEAPVHMAILGEWFDDMVSKPIMPSELRALPVKLVELQEKQKVDSEANIKATEEIKVQQSKDSIEIKSELKGIKEDQQAMNQGILNLYGSHKENVKVMDKFAVAMDEHLALVKELQGTTGALDRGFKLQQDMSVKQYEMFQKQIDHQNSAILQVLEMVKELKTPWYVKLARFIRSIFKRKPSE